MKKITIVQAAALLALAMFGAYASAHEPAQTSPMACITKAGTDSCPL